MLWNGTLVDNGEYLCTEKPMSGWQAEENPHTPLSGAMSQAHQGQKVMGFDRHPMIVLPALAEQQNCSTRGVPCHPSTRLPCPGTPAAFAATTPSMSQHGLDLCAHKGNGIAAHRAHSRAAWLPAPLYLPFFTPHPFVPPLRGPAAIFPALKKLEEG